MKLSIKTIFALQAVVILYTLSSVAAKFAAQEGMLTFKGLCFVGAEILILGIYAIAWQQIIKRCQLSVAYANRSMAILWSLIWAVLFFQEQITLKNVLGVVIVFAGTMIVNSDGE